MDVAQLKRVAEKLTHLEARLSAEAMDSQRRVARLSAEAMDNPILSQLFRVLGRLEARDSTNKWERQPPLDEETVAAWEAQYGVRLPEEYRAFVREIGETAVGPGAGLLPLREQEVELGPDGTPYPFPLVAPTGLREQLWAEAGSPADWNDSDWRQAAQEYHAGHDESEDPAYIEPITQWEATYGVSFYEQGMLLLADYGCAIQAYLVLTGPERGQVWINEHLDHTYPYPTYATFLEWYEGCLDFKILNLHGTFADFVIKDLGLET